MTGKRLKPQQGMTLISWLIVISIALFFTLIGMKMVPTYLENYAIRQVLENMTTDRSVRDMGRRDLKITALKRFRINGVYDFRKDDVKVVKDKGGYRISVDYEVRKPVVGNVFIVMTFAKSVVVPG
jgi:hypothetical protein